MQAGEQIFSHGFFANISKYQLYVESIENSLVMGLPTATGGEHLIVPYSQIGIGANTDHIDAAWSFVRGFLLPSAVEFDSGIHGGDIGFPIRIDLFDKLIEDAMTPRMFINREGEMEENPRELVTAQDGSGNIIKIFAMSEETANSLRAFIESAVQSQWRMSDEMWIIIEGDLADFYSGARSAEETARIIQNRAERWMSEQQLLAGG
jgi:hypothetical protein